MSPLPIRRILTTVYKPFTHGLQQLIEFTEVLIISVPFSGEKGMKAMVKIVIPLGVETVTSLRQRIDDPHIIKIAFRHHPNRTSHSLCLSVNGLPDVIQYVLSAEIEDSVDGIDPETIHMIFGHPVKSILNDESPDLITPRPIKVDSRTPWRLVAVSKIRCVITEIVSLRSQMVVNDVEKDGQAVPVAGISEILQPVRSAITVLRGVKRNAIIPPVPFPGELRHGHQLDGRYPEILFEIVKKGDDPFERSFLRERPGVDLIENDLSRRDPSPVLIFPLKQIWIDDFGRTVNPLGLKS
jgi:hypothetical protein